MSLHDYLPIKRRAPEHEKGTKKPKRIQGPESVSAAASSSTGRPPSDVSPGVKTGQTPAHTALPDHYKLLLEKFRCADTIVNMLQMRHEVCTLAKLKKAVQDIMRRTFEECNLGQMKTVLPTAFVFRQEKGIPGTYGNLREREQYHLTIECGGLKEEKYLDSAALVERTQAFRNGLLKIVFNHHKSFLKTRLLPIDIPEKEIIWWHPNFDLKAVPDVEVAELPKPPLKESYTTARDVLAAAHHSFAFKLQRALANSSSQKCDETPHSPAIPPSPVTPTAPQLDPTLVGISPLLLERIRLKEAARATAVITRDPAVEKKLCMLEKLPKMCRIVKSYFVSEQKAALLQDDVVQKVSESSGVPKECVEEHLRLLREAVPEWMALVTVRNRDYLKIKKQMEMKTIIGLLEQYGANE